MTEIVDTKDQSIDDIIDSVVTEVPSNDEPTNDDQQTTIPAEGVATEGDLTVEELKIPENWESPIKDFINGIEDQSGKQTFFDKFKKMDDGYNSKFQSLADERKTFEGDKQFLDSYRGFENSIDPSMKTQIMAGHGNIPSYMASLHNLDKLASQDPSAFPINYCNNNNITKENLDQVLSGQANQNHKTTQSIDGAVQNLNKQWEDKFEALQGQMELKSLTSAKNDAGEAKYPHLETLREDIGYFMSKGLDFEGAYKRAEMSNPDVSKAVLASQASLQAKQLENERAKVQKAVKPSTNPTNITNTNETMDEIIAGVMGENGLVA